MEAGRMVLGSIEELHRNFTRAHKLVRLRVPAEDTATAQKARQALGDVITCEIENGWVIAASAQDNCNFILRELLDRDIQVLELQEDKPDLEDMFIHSTAGRSPEMTIIERIHLGNSPTHERDLPPHVHADPAGVWFLFLSACHAAHRHIGGVFR
ncbi:MAG: hypothetical protein R3F19_34385 [Verrucomicrobiales bacterium]